MKKVLGMICLSLSLQSMAQVTVSGTVSNTLGENLPDAKIRIENSYQGTYSKTDGTYQLSQLKQGTYVLKVSLVGYESQTKELVVADKNIQVNWKLVPSAVMIEEVHVSATRAGESTPTTFTNLSKEQIESSNFGQDLPYLLEGTPSTVVTSDAGAGIGYTGVRIRGVDPTRTNVTVNGIPINDAESHGVFWVNMPDLSSSIESIQVQRGVGTSSNGAAAFGSSINIKSDQIAKKAYGVLDNSVGSFNTLRHTLKAGTGLINNRFVMDVRLSKITSDGYIDRASSDLKSFFVSGAWIGKNSLLKATAFSGKERTYQAWYGTPESVIKGNTEDRMAYADRNFLSDKQRENLLNAGRTYNFYEYENEVDNYQQDHYQLHFTKTFSSNLNMTAAGHYTRGRGYFEQFREQDDLERYGLNPVILGGDTVTNSDIIRRRWLDNHFYGGVFSVNYTNLKGFNLTVGGGANVYDGDHFGEIIWAQYASNSSIYDEYYRNNALKFDANVYAKATYQYKKITAFADAQFRYIDYSFLGVDDVSNEMKEVQDQVVFPFFNPKVGFTYEQNESNTFYASYSIAHREPVRDDFRENTPGRRPTFEQLRNLEAGFKRNRKKYYLQANVYWMDYTDQLILTGQINDVGGYTRTNVDKSYRLGIEFDGGYRISKWITLSANAMLSRNKVQAFTNYMDNYDDGGQIAMDFFNTDLAFSPNVIAGLGAIVEPVKNLQFTFLAKHVGSQFLDNTSNQNRKLDAYTFGNASINYTIEKVAFKEIQIGVLVNNIWNTRYENNGYTYSYFYNGSVTTENFYYPQAGTNFLVRVLLKM